MNPAELLLTAPMVALVPSHDGVILAALDDSAGHDVVTAVCALDQLALLAPFARRHDRV